MGDGYICLANQVNGLMRNLHNEYTYRLRFVYVTNGIHYQVYYKMNSMWGYVNDEHSATTLSDLEQLIRKASSETKSVRHKMATGEYMADRYIDGEWITVINGVEEMMSRTIRALFNI